MTDAHIAEIATTATGLGVLLIGCIYRDIMRRVSSVEKMVYPAIIDLTVDVKFIRANCPRCEAIATGD